MTKTLKPLPTPGLTRVPHGIFIICLDSQLTPVHLTCLNNVLMVRVPHPVHVCFVGLASKVLSLQLSLSTHLLQ